MKNKLLNFLMLLALTLAPAGAAVHYVNLANPAPAPPYTTWASAATTIQDAIDVADAGDEIVVTDGVYDTGERALKGTLLANRVAVTKPVTLRSVNGPDVTVIQGYQVPGIGNGDGAVRCVYLTGGAVLAGFTLTNGATRAGGNRGREQQGGGVWCEFGGAVVSNCVVAGNSARDTGGGASGCTLQNCTLTGNSARVGGGAAGCTLDTCTLTGNSAGYGGGGADSCTLNNCVLFGNLATGDGGGTFESTLNNCTLTGNSAANGGGAARGTLNNCNLAGNSAWFGAGAFQATLINCTLTGNSATFGGGGGGAAGSTLNNCILTGNSGSYGGGAFGCALHNCTLTGNSATNRYGEGGGGASDSMLNNCIAYYNTATVGGPNYSRGTFNYSCTTPLPTGGVGNITVEPQLANAWRLSAGSPCRGAGSAAYASGVDIDGESWANPPSIGCDEFHSGVLTGPLQVAITASYTTVAAGFEVNFTAQINGRTSASRWEFGDGTVISNRLYLGHAWAVPGDYPVALRAYNETYPAGVAATAIIHVVEGIFYVSQDSSHPMAPYNTWATAATNIQDAVDAATIGGVVLVTNGVYQTGGRASSTVFLTNRVAITKPITVRSVNGPELTVIRGRPDGAGAVRCVYLGEGATLVGFTLTNGAALVSNISEFEANGGGIWCAYSNAIVMNCTLTGNTAACAGGGAYQGTLKNCTLVGNSAYSGGGAADSTLNNCTLVGNSARSGGGAADSTLNNCTLTGNWAGDGGGGATGGTLHNCFLEGNSSGQVAGGAARGTLNGCTITGNSAMYGGGASECTLNNCIVYYNTAGRIGDNFYDFLGGSLNYSCTTPLPSEGVGNITDEPQLTSASQISTGSPCRGAGNASYTTGTDIDGEPWANPPSIGCDEFHSGVSTGLLRVAIAVSHTNVGKGFEVNFTAQIRGRTSASRWEFGDGTVISNRPYAAHAWAVPGDYPVVLRAYNETYPEGVGATVMVHVVEEILYVSQNSSHPVAPYNTWATAATNIQDAVDAASVVGAMVVVTNGVYAAGGRVADGALTNRVAVTKPLTLRSVNGPAVTVIQGYQVPGTTNGDAAVRCVYLASRAALVGFTLTNGATRRWLGDESTGGGVICESASATVSNCTLTGNSASYGGGGASQSTLNNCTLSGNSAQEAGGGAYLGTLNNCTLTGNSASYGGGAFRGVLNGCTLRGNSAFRGAGVSQCTLNHCTLSGNLAQDSGGGAYQGTLNNSTLRGNSANYGAGAAAGTLNGCTLTGNSAGLDGGGSWGNFLNSCTITGNSAGFYGGGASGGYVNNCTVTGNLAGLVGGGVYHSLSVNNCIVYHNTATQSGPNYASETGTPTFFNYSCTTPLPTDGVGNFTDEPQLADSSHLTESSPCRGRGNPASATGVDIDGQPWAFPPSVGCDELRPITGPLAVAIHASCRFVPTEYPVDLTSQIEGHTTALRWDFGEGIVVGNQLKVTHRWATPGEHTVVLTAFNDAHLEGVTTSLTVIVSAAPDPVLYVSLNSATPAFPYDSWNTAARTIQDALDVLCTGGTIIVSNGVYGPVNVTQPVTLRSLNGPQVTSIDGGGAARCVYLGSSGTALSGFTLTHGFAEYGGGVWCDGPATVSNCVIVANHASYSGGGSWNGTLYHCTFSDNSALLGGGAYQGTLNNCILRDNAAELSGGGAFGGALNNCTLIGNWANQSGGGVGGGNLWLLDVVPKLNNCIIWHNVAGQDGDNFDSSSQLNGSCTTPLPPSGRSNFENRPRLVDLVGGDFHLQPDSPCINAGLNIYAADSTDLDGNPRIAGGTIDVGAYEFQSPQSLLSYAWLQQFGLPTDGSADHLDLDGDDFTNYQEWRSGTDPTDPLSALRLLTPERSDPDLVIGWASVPGKEYFLERSTNLTSSGSFIPIARNIPGQTDSTSYTDANVVTNGGRYFYRVGVE